MTIFSQRREMFWRLSPRERKEKGEEFVVAEVS